MTVRTARLLFVFLALALAPSAANARPNVDRRGGHMALSLGASACLPGKARCARDDAGDLAPGRTRLGFAFGAELGFRWKYFLLGGAYDFGMFRPDYDIVDAPGYRTAYQQGVYALLRPMLPVWRFDLGVDLAPGFSRQTFRRRDASKEFSQGFSMRLGPIVHLFVARRVFLGARLSFLVNAHGRTCRDEGESRVCEKTTAQDVAGVHQVFFGLVVGGTFL